MHTPYRHEPWISDQGDGTYRNPVLHADYSDPDVIRVGDDFYMTASSFHHIPGLPILHSKDLVNWTIINHAMRAMPLPHYDVPQHGKGIWAPSLRCHDNKYWIFYGDPDVGILMTTADHPANEWAPLHLVQEGKGLIDPCPFWDDDGQAYLVHAFAESRSGVKDRLCMRSMTADGRKLLDGGQIIFESPERHPTMEGPKMYKRNGYYYVSAPAGGVATGWQTVLRASNPFGPYTDRIVLHQGSTPVNGPHQGAWVELESGEYWFLHFQDKGLYGRILHLQPMVWKDNWPWIGEQHDSNGIGEPVLRYQKPNVGRSYPIAVPATSDHFDRVELGLQWQWQANPHDDWYSLTERPGYLRMYANRRGEHIPSIYDAPYLMLQKFPAPSFHAVAKVDVTGLASGNEAGIIIFGYNHARIAVRRGRPGGGDSLTLTIGDQATERTVWSAPIEAKEMYLRVSVYEPGVCRFSYSADGEQYDAIPVPEFTASQARWVGAKVGLYAESQGGDGGYADFEWFQMTAI